MCCCFALHIAKIAVDVRDPDHCQTVLSSGQWLSSNNWQPTGCLLHHYEQLEMVQCLNGTELVFQGDETVLDVFMALARRMHYDVRMLSFQQGADIHLTPLDFAGSHISDRPISMWITLLWDPYLNRTNIPHAHLVSTGLWQALYLEDSLKAFKTSYNRILLSHYGNSPIIAPVSVPPHNISGQERDFNVIRDKIDAMNKLLHNIPRTHSSEIAWAFTEMLAVDVEHSRGCNSMHIADPLADIMADLLLNKLCNHHEAIFTLPGTCCRLYTGLKWTQWVVILAAIYVVLFRATRHRGGLLTILAVSYCILADRTSLYDKLNKQYHASNFYALIGAAAVLGAFTVRRSTAEHAGDYQNNWTSGHISEKSALPTSRSDGDYSHPVPFLLGQEQIDEFRGCIQAVILIYDYTGASEVYWAYVVARHLIASYIFLLGYETTLSTLSKDDRVFQTMFSTVLRLNGLSVVLSYMTGLRYVDYCLPPLLTVWYLVAHITLRSQLCANPVVSIGVSAILVSGISKCVLTPGLPLLKAWAIHWDIDTISDLLTQDRYIVFAGMATALVSTRNLQTVFGQANLFSMSHPRLLHWVPVIVSIVSTYGYYLLVSLLDRTTYDENFHTYLSWVPILSYLYLRNSTSWLRTHVSAAFAALGRMSLEAFVLQNHIWLGADGHGILSSGMFEESGSIISGRWRDMILFSVAFMWLSKGAADGVRVSVQWLTKSNSRDENENHVG